MSSYDNQMWIDAEKEALRRYKEIDESVELLEGIDNDLGCIIDLVDNAKAELIESAYIDHTDVAVWLHEIWKDCQIAIARVEEALNDIKRGENEWD